MSKHNFYDLIIIGSGMAGLYTAYRLRQEKPYLKLLIIESNHRIGGRACNDTFQGVTVAPGAGVGRYKKDKLLRELMKELGMEINKFSFQPHYSECISPVIDVNQVMDYLRKMYFLSSSPSLKSITFSEFAKKMLGEKLFRQFVTSSGHTDYLQEDVYETLYHYGMEDNACCWDAFSVRWKDLTENMAKFIGPEHICLSTRVLSITRTDSVQIVTTKNRKYLANQIVVATAIDTVQRLFPKHPIYKEIRGQPFMRVFAKFSKKSIPMMKEAVKTYTIVRCPLQKIIPIKPDEGIYMIAYNDNECATWTYHLEKDENRCEKFAEMVEQSLGLPESSLTITDLKGYYWPTGTHYFTPLQKRIFRDRETFLKCAQRPSPSIFLVGEAFSMNQGWVEGALESVESIFRLMI